LFAQFRCRAGSGERGGVQVGGWAGGLVYGPAAREAHKSAGGQNVK